MTRRQTKIWKKFASLAAFRTARGSYPVSYPSLRDQIFSECLLLYDKMGNEIRGKIWTPQFLIPLPGLRL